MPNSFAKFLRERLNITEKVKQYMTEKVKQYRKINNSTQIKCLFIYGRLFCQKNVKIMFKKIHKPKSDNRPDIINKTIV